MTEGKPKNIAELKEIISRFSLCAKVNDDGSVAVDDGMGNGLYLANANVELAWLKAVAQEVEDRGAVKIFHECCSS